MHGDPELGAVLRELRTARKLTLAAVARRAGCAESLLSQVETGRRQLQPWLAECLDTIYGTGSALAGVLRRAYPGSLPTKANAALSDDVLLVCLPQKGLAMPVSRRELLTALGVGALGGAMLGSLDEALRSVAPTRYVLVELEQSLTGFHALARAVPPTHLIDSLTGQVAVIDILRRRGSTSMRHDLAILQSRYAESLSWMCEEAGNLHGSLFWTDRASQWAQTVNWLPMVTYTFVRRSMMAISFMGDGLRAAESASYVLEMPGAPARIKGLAAKQMGFGYALAGQADDSARALDLAMQFFDRAQGDDEIALGQRSVVSDDLLAIFQATCDVYRGFGEAAIATLEPRLPVIFKASPRTHTITCAKLAHAYANIGQPEKACRLMLQTFDAAEAVGSLSARSELRRALPVLGNWPNRPDVQKVRHRFGVS